MNPYPHKPPNCSLDTISGTFNFVFTILFNFPSQYFSAIGLHVIFRFGRNLPPVLRTIPKVRDSKAKGDPWNQQHSLQGFHLHWRQFPLNFTCVWSPPASCSKGASECSITETHPFPLTYSIFVRHYWWNLIWFLFLGLIICLNSPRNEEGKDGEKFVFFSFMKYKRRNHSPEEPHKF